MSATLHPGIDAGPWCASLYIVKLLLWGIFLGLTMVSVGGAEGKPPRASAEGTNALRTIAKGALSGISEAQQQVITNRAEWQQWWSKHASRQKAPAPEIDFDQEMAIAVTMGRQRTGGYAIEIAKVAPRGNELVISVSRRSPPPNSITTQALTAPFHIVAVPRSRLTPKFIETPQ